MNVYNYYFKFFIVGDSYVGKSCLISQFSDSRFTYQHHIQDGLEFDLRNLKVIDEQIGFLIWDTPRNTQLFYRRSIGGILVFEVTRRESFEDLQKWYQVIQEFTCDKLEMVIVGNKIDLDDMQQQNAYQFQKRVKTEEAMKYAQKQGVAYLKLQQKQVIMQITFLKQWHIKFQRKFIAVKSIPLRKFMESRLDR